MSQVNIRSSKEDMDHRAFGLAHCLPDGIDVADAGASKSCHSHTAHTARNLLHRHKIAGRGRRKACLDDIDIEAHKLVGHLYLLFKGHCRAGRLLAIAQGRVKNPNYRRVCHDVVPPCSLITYFFASAISGRLSTGLSQGIIARSSEPICSIWCWALALRMALKLGRPAWFSRIQRVAKVPS